MSRSRARLIAITAAVAITLCLGTPARADLLEFTAVINGAQETPSNGSPATGSGTFTLDTVANTLSFNVTFSGLPTAENAAHIHGFAPPGTPAPILFPLALGSPKIGVWDFSTSVSPTPATIQTNIIAGQTYVNIHSMTLPAGEIRGQIIQTIPATSLSSLVILAALLASAGAGFLLRRRRARVPA